MKEKIQAKNGMILTNGEIYGKVIYLGANFSKDDFYEITDEEYKEIMARESEEHSFEN